MGDLGIEGIGDARQLSSGAAVTTYTSTDADGRPVEVVVLHRQATPEVRARFDYDQARLEELAEHPNIVTVLRHGYTAGGEPFVIRAAVEGGSMADKVGAGLDGPGVLSLGIRIAGALESAHRRDVVHGDLRPEDIKIDAAGEPELADLGVALVTGVGPDRATDVAGLAHCAPEQLTNHVPSPATDVYALGSVLYALLAGGPAFARAGDVSVAAVGARILNEQPADLRPGGVPGAVVDAIERALAKDPARRWASAEAFGLALQQAEITLGLPITPMTVLGPERASTRPGPDALAADAVASPSGPPPKQGSKVPLVVGGLVLLAAAGVAAALLLGGGDDDADEDADDGRTPATRDADVEIELVEATDDSGTITVQVLERWSDVDGRPLDNGDDTSSPDLLAATDAASFLDVDGFNVSGIEVTVPDGVDSAEALLADRIDTRGLDDDCTNDGAGADAEEVGGFVGLLQRFRGCDGHDLVVFAGVDGGRGLVAEVHLVEDEDEAALEDILDSIEVG